VVLAVDDDEMVLALVEEGLTAPTTAS